MLNYWVGSKTKGIKKKNMVPLVWHLCPALQGKTTGISTGNFIILFLTNMMHRGTNNQVTYQMSGQLCFQGIFYWTMRSHRCCLPQASHTKTNHLAILLTKNIWVSRATEVTKQYQNPDPDCTHCSIVHRWTHPLHALPLTQKPASHLPTTSFQAPALD